MQPASNWKKHGRLKTCPTKNPTIIVLPVLTRRGCVTLDRFSRTMKNALQINYWTIGGFDGAKPVAQALAEAKKMGYDGLELAFGAGCFAPGISDAECQNIRREARRLGMRLDTVASGAYWNHSLSDPRAAVRREAIAFTKEYLRAARGVGAKVALVVPGAVDVPWDASQPVVSYKTVWRYATVSLRELLPVAKEMKVAMALENVWNWFLSDPMSMRQFVDQFRSRFIALFDVGNCLTTATRTSDRNPGKRSRRD